MKKYIYHKGFRCRIKFSKYLKHNELQVQQLKWYGWTNVGKWMTVAEGFWGECERFPILRSSYQYGNRSESYMTGTLDLSKRAKEFIEEYIQEVNDLNSKINKFNSLK